MLVYPESPGWRRGSLFVANLGLVLLGLPAAAPHAARPNEGGQTPDLQKGVVIEKVTTMADPSQSYALYLPSSYSPDKPWPIVYAFDPVARGDLPVRQMQAMAEEYGYILAGSNNSRNGPAKAQFEAAEALWDDTHRRFSIDSQRVYATGFSGGGRVAGMIALSCDRCIAGVIAHGAGLPSNSSAGKVNFNFFGAIGSLDFNYMEVVRLGQELEKLGISYRIRRYPGPHQWAPPEIWEEAFEWMELMAMKQGSRPKEESFIARVLAREAGRARELEESGKPYVALGAYKQLVRDFQGLADTSSYKARIAALQNSREVRKGEKLEQEEFRRQERIVAEMQQLITGLGGDAATQALNFAQLRNAAGELRKKAEKRPDAAESAAIRRALSFVYAVTIESGLNLLQSNAFPTAVLYFEAASAVQPDAPAPHFYLARAYARSGNKEKGLAALEKAVENGLHNAELLRNTSEFSVWQAEPDFQKLLERLAPS